MDDLNKLAWDSIKWLLEWIILHELEPEPPEVGRGDSPCAAEGLVIARERRKQWGVYLLTLLEEIKVSTRG